MSKCGIALLDRIQEAFAAKSQGGTDQAGERWEPLSPKTIAYRRAKRSRVESSRGKHPSQALTEEQTARWWAIYKRQLAKFRGDKSSAARVAWTILKREGAQTLFDKYSKEKVDVLRDTNELMNSLTPNSGSSKSIFRVLPGEVEVGTNRDHAITHHKGIPGKLPQRRLWPSVNRWPDNWWYDILSEVQDGIVGLTIQAINEVSGQ